MKLINRLSQVPLPIDLYHGETLLGPATAFYWQHESDSYLISNWHVFSGRNPDTGQPLSETFLTPTRIRIKHHHESILGSYTYGHIFHLEDESGQPNWRQHVLGQEVDLAFIKVASTPDFTRPVFANLGEREDLVLSVATEVYALGFQRGFSKQGIWPIWKRATIAAEPDIEREDGKRFYLIDTATREGMSGSPVYIYANGHAQTGDGIVSFFNGPVFRFIGVYSGRYGAEEENGMQLGRVWHRDLITEMLRSSHLGSYSINKLST